MVLDNKTKYLRTGNMMSRSTETLFERKYAIMMNKAIRTLLNTNNRRLRYFALYQSSLGLITISDRSFANNPDLYSQLGHIILQTDKSDEANTLSYASYMFRLIVRSVRGA